jgi:hypothetical protein
LPTVGSSAYHAGGEATAMRRTGWLTWVLLAASLCSVSPARAAKSVATPPGNSAGNEYVETLPGPTGNQALGPAGSALLPPAVMRALASQGTPGLLVLALGPRSASATRAGRGSTSLGATAGGPGRLRPNAPATRPEAPSVAFSNLLIGTGPGGLGWGLPAILAAIAVAALGFARRRGSSKSSRRP